MLSTAKSANVGFRPAVQLFAHPQTLLNAEKVAVGWLGCGTILRMNKWFPDIQLRLLDVGFPTFNLAYCTSGSWRYVLFFLDVGFPTFNVTYNLLHVGFPTCRHSLPKTLYLPSDSNWSSRECYDGASTIRDNGCWTTSGYANLWTGQLADWTTRGCHLRLCALNFRFLAIRETASWPVRELAICELANPWVVQLPCVYGHIRTPDLMVTIYHFITHILQISSMYKFCAGFTNAISQTTTGNK